MKKNLFSQMINLSRSGIIACFIASMLISVLQMLGRYLDVRNGDISMSFSKIAIEGILFFIFCNVSIIVLWKLAAYDAYLLAALLSCIFSWNLFL